jgi:DNA-binding YbaB/EbfC family protein
VEASAGGGAIKILINGQQKVHKVTLSSEVDPDDRELLEDLILTAVNEAITKSQELAQSRMGEVTAGLKLPGMPGIPGLGRRGFR